MNYCMRLIALSVVLFTWMPMGFAQDQYLLSKPIRSALMDGDYSVFKGICTIKVSTNFESPVELTGYIYKEKFIEEFAHRFSRFTVLRIEGGVQQIESTFAVQSINVMMKHKRTDKTVYYKLIFFMTKIEQEWKIYYFKGLRI